MYLSSQYLACAKILLGFRNLLSSRPCLGQDLALVKTLALVKILLRSRTCLCQDLEWFKNLIWFDANFALPVFEPLQAVQWTLL